MQKMLFLSFFSSIDRIQGRFWHVNVIAAATENGCSGRRGGRLSAPSCSGGGTGYKVPPTSQRCLGLY